MTWGAGGPAHQSGQDPRSQVRKNMRAMPGIARIFFAESSDVDSGLSIECFGSTRQS